MGTLTHVEAGEALLMPDRTLNHIQIAMTRKFAKGEGFFYRYETEAGTQKALWLSPSTPIVIEYGALDLPGFNTAWVDQMLDGMNSPTGFLLLTEPE